MKEHSYRTILLEKFQERSAKNPSYKMSAFARDLGIRQSRLTEILGGRQGLSKMKAAEISAKLGMSPVDAEYFCLLVTKAHARSRDERILASVKIARLLGGSSVFKLSKAETAGMRWYYFATGSLLQLKNFRFNAENVAKTLEIELGEAERAIKWLMEKGFIKNEGGRLEIRTDRVEFFSDTDSGPDSFRLYITETMRRSERALTEQPSAQRQFGSSIFALGKKDIQEFKNIIWDFQRKIDERAANGSDKDSVYCLSYQFFEISKL